MFGLSGFLAAIQCVGLYFMPKSPRFLLISDKRDEVVSYLYLYTQTMLLVILVLCILCLLLGLPVKWFELNPHITGSARQSCLKLLLFYEYICYLIAILQAYWSF